MSSEGSGQQFTTRIAGIEGTWPDPPDWWSFSSLSEVEACPRRWSLKRANYPGLWDQPGYPEYVYVGTVVGHVIHGSLEIIIESMVRAGCTSVDDASAVDVLRSLGGFTHLLRDQIESHVRRLADNPRCSSILGQLRRDLLTRLPEMRQSVQALVARSEFTANSRARGANASDGAVSKRLGDGTYPEFEVRSDQLSFLGRIDLLTVSGRGLHLTDYKAGAPSNQHEDQLRTYATLWARRSDLDPDLPLATRLTISYVEQDVEVDPPNTEEIDRLAQELQDRIRNATLRVTSAEPPAIPAADTCRFCSVRHLCEDYWRTLDARPANGAIDAEIEVIEQNGPRSWRVRSDSAHECILMTSEGEEFAEGQQIRVLGALVWDAEEGLSPTITLGARSEWYALTPPSSTASTQAQVVASQRTDFTSGD